VRLRHSVSYFGSRERGRCKKKGEVGARQDWRGLENGEREGGERASGCYTNRVRKIKTAPSIRKRDGDKWVVFRKEGRKKNEQRKRVSNFPLKSLLAKYPIVVFGKNRIVTQKDIN